MNPPPRPSQGRMPSRYTTNTIQFLCERKARDSNPQGPRRAARFSKPARPAVSGYLPRQSRVERPESRAREDSIIPFRLWTLDPPLSTQLDPPGVEPGSPPRQGGVVPLDHEPRASAEWGMRSAEQKSCLLFRTPRSAFRTSVIPDGFEPSLSWMSPRRLRRWTTGSKARDQRSAGRRCGSFSDL